MLHFCDSNSHRYTITTIITNKLFPEKLSDSDCKQFREVILTKTICFLFPGGGGGERLLFKKEFAPLGSKFSLKSSSPTQTDTHTNFEKALLSKINHQPESPKSCFLCKMVVVYEYPFKSSKFNSICMLRSDCHLV